MSHYSDAQDIEFATAVAAAAFSIHSNEEAKLQYQKGARESIPISRTKSLQELMTGQPNKEARNAGEVSTKDQRAPESTFPSRHPNRASSSRPSTPANGYQNQKGSSDRRKAADTKADAWERAQMKNIQRRNQQLGCAEGKRRVPKYEKVKATIVAWENEKKMKAKAKMERRKNEIEQRRARNMQHYQIKQARIDQVAGGARAQVEERRRNEEAKVKGKAKRIRSTGKAPATCFCFTCY